MSGNIFQTVKAALSTRLPEILPQLLPGGRSNGREYLCASLEGGAGINTIVDLPVREDIGRYKYTPENEIEAAYERVSTELTRQMAGSIGKED